MKSKVHLNLFSRIITISVIVLMGIIIVSEWNNPEKLTVAVVITVGLAVCGIFFYPTSIETNPDYLVVNHPLTRNRIPFSKIVDAQRCFPSPGGIRLCGSGGFCGYWGYFHDIVIGTYSGWYGDFSQCILIKLSDNKQYVISCVDTEEMLTEICSRIKK